jgi:alpha-glucosidase (family GH31 glycosyl hydrolase)
MHSDLGGFAGPVLDDELYVRWLQYGVFQPIFRPHAQESVPSEPVFRAPAAKALARDAIRLRYALLPYNYTIAFENSRSGMPLMRPILFEEPESDMVPTGTISSTYLWGPDILVAPVTEPGALRKEVYFPRPGTTWFDFYSDAPHRGGIIETVPTVSEHIPTFVRAGAFVPMSAPVQTTRDYATRKLDLHYWHDAGVSAGHGQLYDDDGATARAFEAGKYELVRFTSTFDGKRLAIGLAPETGRAATASARDIVLKVHNVAARPRAVSAGGKPLAYGWDAKRKVLDVTLPTLRGAPLQLEVAL